jgi:acyl carrier protein
MTEQEILTGFAQTVEEFADVPASKVTLEADLTDDLEIDSLSMVEIVVSAQDKFGVEIPDDQLGRLKTVQDVVRYVQRAQRSGVSA